MTERPASTLEKAAHAAFDRGDYRGASQLVQRLSEAGQADVADSLLNAFCQRLAPGRDGHVAFAMQRAGLRQARGDMAGALSLYFALAQQHPGRADVQNNLGTTQLALGDAAAALRAFDAALAARPGYARGASNRGRALIELGRVDEALAAFLSATSFDPTYAEAHSNAGVALGRLGRPDEAIAAHKRAIAIRPEFAAAYLNLGKIALERDPVVALDAYQSAARLAPGAVEAWRGVIDAQRLLKDAAGEIAALNALLGQLPGDRDGSLRLGRLHCQQGRPTDAVPVLERALIANSGDLELRWQLARALIDAGSFERGMVAFEALLDAGATTPKLRQDYVRALMRLAEARGIAQNYELGLEEIKRVIEDLPEDVEAWMTRGLLYERLDRLEEAEQAFARARAIEPDGVWPRFKHWDMQLVRAQWTEHATNREWLATLLETGRAGVEPHFVTRVIDDAHLQQCASRLQINEAATLAAPRRPCVPRRSGPLRVAYVSADFHNHPVAFAIVELLERHDRSRVHVSALSLGSAGQSEMATRIRNAVDEFHELDFGSYVEADAWLRGGDYDVLVDLMGHTRGCRPLYFARRPGRVQVLYLGYPGTMGAPWLDYVLADGHVIPVAQDAFYDEAVARLPGSFFPTDTTRVRPATNDTRAKHGLPDGAVVYCNFLARGRLTPEAFERWLSVLRQVPASVLWLAAERPDVESRVRAFAAERGVDAHRIIFAGRVATREEHLARHRHADLWLDSYPYCAHSTGRDALWMGLPLLTCTGNSFPSRVAGSLLSALGLPELIAPDGEAFIERAVSLGRDPAALAALRSRVEQRVAASELFDTARLAGAIESAFEQMVEREQRGLPPASFDVVPTK